MMYRITLAQAEALIEAGIAEAARHKMKPLTLGVFDPTGALVALERQDGAPMIGAKVVTGKANGALAMGVSSRTVSELSAARPQVFAAIGALCSSGFVPSPGALLIQDANGTLIGAMAASGDTSDNDERAVQGAIEEAGFQVA